MKPDYLSTQTAILIFARTARGESRCKQLHPDKAVNTDLQQTLLHKTIDTATDSQLPFFVIDETQQYGGSFGERFINAFQAVFSRGFDNVIAIGSDCAALTCQHILTAHNHLEKGVCITGPDDRGGVYLLGLTKDAFNAAKLTCLNWNNNKTRCEIQGYFTEQGLQQYNLTILSDINTARDLYSIIKSKYNRFFLILKSLLQPLHRLTGISTNVSVNSLFFSHHILRGPPSFA